MTQHANDEQRLTDDGQPSAEQSSSQNDHSVLSGLSSVYAASLAYIRANIDLALLEVRLAAHSVVLIAITALFALLLLFTAWGLGNYALALWLTTAQIMSTLAAILVLIGINLVAGLVLLSLISRLTKPLSFPQTRSMLETQEAASDNETEAR